MQPIILTGACATRQKIETYKFTLWCAGDTNLVEVLCGKSVLPIYLFSEHISNKFTVSFFSIIEDMGNSDVRKIMILDIA